MSTIQLITFRGCPHAGPVRAILTEARIPFEEIEQADLPAGDPLRGYTSPTILRDGALVLGAKTDGASLGCSLSSWTRESVLAALAGRIEASTAPICS